MASGQEAMGHQEAEVGRQVDKRRRRQRDSQSANEGQTGGDGASRASGFAKRTRGGGSGAMRGVATTSRGTRRMGGEAPADKRHCVSNASSALIQREAEVLRQEDMRRRQRIIKTRGRGRGGANRCDATTSQCKQNVEWRWTILPPPSKKLW